MIVKEQIAAEPNLASSYGLENHGLTDLGHQYWNLHTPQLYEQVIRRDEGTLAHLGSLVVNTGAFTGRSPNDKFFVREASSEKNIWWGAVNQPLSPENFEKIYEGVCDYFKGKDVFVQDCFAGADKRYRLPVRVISELAWHSLFARTMLIRPPDADLQHHKPEFTIIQAPFFLADPETEGTKSSTVIAVSLERKLVIIAGTEYAGEAKKSVFTLMNYLLPLQGVLSMHCSANYGKDKDDAALFFGLSGTGKTTLSADPQRTLIGDDEHGWSDHGIFNIEGGCYAKVIHLSRTGEPEIYATTRRFGTVLENVVIDPANRYLNLDDDSFTENTRAAYPITHIPNADLGGVAGNPKNVIFLTADAFGVLPPLARLTDEQAMYHFISGYTAKVAGTERGMGSEPSATFSACFGAPFMPLHPTVYATLLQKKLQQTGAKVWLINTGWTGGPFGVGTRMKLNYTRAMVAAVLNGELDNATFVTDPIFGLAVPTHVNNVPDAALDQRGTWSNPAAYDATAKDLAQRFKKNFEKYADRASAEIIKGAPLV